MTKLNNKLRTAVGAAAIGVIALAGCGSNATDTAVVDSEPPQAITAVETSHPFAKLSYTTDPVVHHDDGGRVSVAVSSAWSDDGLLVIRGVFTPDDEGFHLYSNELPRQGVDGIGRPTLIEVDDVEFVKASRPLVASAKAHEHHDSTLDMTFSLFPDGPVTLYLPLQIKDQPQSPMQLPVKLTYMSCSEMRCNSPVEGAVAEIVVPAVAINAE